MSWIKTHYLELIIISSFITYGLWFIFRTSFVINNQRYFCLFDDAMISMTYAKNFLNGYGLNWAKYGKPVEGYTHPLWVFLMILSDLFVKSDSLRSLPIQLMSLCFLAINLVYLKKLLITHYIKNYKLYWIPAVLLTAFYYPLNHWSLEGMESGLQALLIISSLYYLLNYLQNKEKDLIKLGITLSLSTLLRIDMVLFAGIIVSAAGIHYLRNVNKMSFKYFLTFLSIIVIPNLVYLIFRIIYFHNILPNTYYLKMLHIPLKVRAMRGLEVFFDFFEPIYLLFFILLIISLKKITQIKTLFPLLITVVYFLYSIYVGGDAWEWSTVGGNRFVIFVVPLLFIILTQVFIDFSDFINHLSKESKIVKSYKDSILFYTISTVSLAFFLSFNGLWLNKDWKTKWDNMVVLNPPVHVKEHPMAVSEVLYLNSIVSKDGVVATVWAGIPGFFGDFKLADILGYNDTYIAKSYPFYEVNDNNFREVYPGHMKLDYEYLMRDLKVDLISHVWGMDKPGISDKFQKLVSQYQYEQKKWYWVKVGSTFVK